MNKATIYINGVIGQDTILLDCIRQFKSYDNPQAVEVYIDSVGGCVDSGLSIFNYLRNLQIPVTTIAKQAYSIAASIYMAGDIRIVEAGEAKIMVHFPWASVDGGANHLESVAKELRAIEKDFITFYSTYTNIDQESIKTLLQSETFLSSNEALEIGIATEIKQPLQAVAIYTNNKEKEEKEMTKTEKFINALNAFFNSEDAVEQVEVNALMIQDANGDVLDFADLEEGAEPQVGDVAKDSEGKVIEGERVLPDGSTFVFEGGELKEILPVEEGEPAEDEAESTEDDIDVEALLGIIEASLFAKLSGAFKKENDELKAEIKALKKLVGSEEAIVAKTNSNNLNKNKRNSNYLRA